MGELFTLIGKVLSVLTDRGILIRIGVALAGLALMWIGAILLLREPVMSAATKVAKAVPL